MRYNNLILTSLETEMSKIKSAVSFFRKQLKIKGRTQHNGRGCYEMEYNCNVEELKTRIADMVAKNPDQFTVAPNGMIELKAELCEQEYYRTLCVSERWGTLIVVM